jgi:hypothetical protein
MSTTKRILGDYNINTIDSSGNAAGEVTVTTEIFRVKGDLVVTGETSSVSETNLNVSNNTIMLNEGESGAGITLGEAAVVIDRGTLNDGTSGYGAGIRFNETTDRWQVSVDGSTWSDLGVTSGGGTALTDVVQDTTPQLGGDLDVNGQSIVSAGGGDIIIAPDTGGDVYIDADLKLKLRTGDPTAEAGYNILYHKTEDAGGSGVFFRTTTTNDELVSKAKAIVYSIIF